LGTHRKRPDSDGAKFYRGKVLSAHGRVIQVEYRVIGTKRPCRNSIAGLDWFSRVCALSTVGNNETIEFRC
jgi:hypothetical protein